MGRVFLAAALGLAAGAGPGCAAVGNYFANRARDLGECFRVQAGLGLGVGGGVKASGLVEVGMGLGIGPNWFGAGWVYGMRHGLLGNSAEYQYTPDWLPCDLQIFFPEAITWTVSGKVVGSKFVLYQERDSRSSRSGTRCSWGLLPGLLSWDSGGHWIWSASGDTDTVWRRIHAFDLEASVYAGIVCARVGFSPGEFLDFLLGWFGLDIAGDDTPVPEPPARRVR